MPTCGPKIIPQEQLHKAHTQAVTVGLGYRIFVVRRYLAMDIIIPYVLWMTVLLFLTDGVSPVGDPQALCLAGQVNRQGEEKQRGGEHVSHQPARRRGELP